jgi:uncharacterized membrane protein
VFQLGALYALARARFDAVHQRTFDLALYTRIAYGLAHADVTTRVLDTTPLGTHLAPILLPLGLLGRISPTGHTVHVLLFAQALSVAGCVFPLARIGARHMGRPGILLGALAWLLYPNLFHVATYEFHPGTLAVLPICWAYDALERGQLRDLGLCCLGVLLCREDFGLMCVIFALLAYARFRRPGALRLAGGCLVYTVAATLFVLQHAPLNASSAQHFGVWGGSPLGVVAALFHDPALVVAHFRAPNKLLYLPRLLAVLSFSPLRASWLLLPAAPYLALNLLSQFPTSCEQFSHYLTPAVPALVVSGVVGASALQKRPWRVLWLITLVLGHYALGGSPASHDFDRSAFREDANSRAARVVMAQIPADADVQAPDALLPHLAERHSLRRSPPPDPAVAWLVLDVSQRQRFAGREDLLRTSEEPVLRAFMASGSHGLRAYAPPYALFERGLDPRAAVAASCFAEPVSVDAEAHELTPCLSLLDASLSGDRLSLRLRANGPCRADLALRFGPPDAPWRVELVCDGKLSPSHFRAGDVLRSSHQLKPAELAAAQAGTLSFGTLRADGKAAAPADPLAIPVRVRQHGSP